MKRLFAVIFVICLAVGLCACASTNEKQEIYNTQGNSGMPHETEALKYDTAYPEDVIVAGASVITVEKAEADLRKNVYHECLDVGTVEFDKLTFEHPDLRSVAAIYWFDISIQYEFGNENYRAKVKYLNGAGGSGEFNLIEQDIDIWQVDSTFTKTGKWTYDNGETHISISFIEMDDTGYVVEYEINYLARYWAESRWVHSSSDGETTVFGDNEWDGDNYYLSIDLGDYYNESEQMMDRGYIKVYPWKGVYWDALNADGGPYKLTKEQ